MITDVISKIKSFLKENQRDLYLAALVFLMSVASFGLGRLSAIWPEKEPIRIDSPTDAEQTRTAADNFPRESASSPRGSAVGHYIASKNGSAYHLPDCPGAKQIKEENKLWFETKEDAERAGYKPAGNCPGL